MIVVVMGVTGTGKSTVGKLLAEQLGWTFVEGDDYHPAANVDKMRQGIPLDDEDRRPWLDAIRHRLDQAAEQSKNVVLACSALKHCYQDYLARHAADAIRFVYLLGSPELIRQRLAERKGHFMNPTLLASQFHDLEPPDHAIRVEINKSPPEIVSEIRGKLGL
ncbi:MAG TPA: gluconokinase [Planctomycetaceae bacterium]|nr:gluconokinase [Planctomycetaceae bacterium]